MPNGDRETLEAPFAQFGEHFERRVAQSLWAGMAIVFLIILVIRKLALSAIAEEAPLWVQGATQQGKASFARPPPPTAKPALPIEHFIAATAPPLDEQVTTAKSKWEDEKEKFNTAWSLEEAARNGWSPDGPHCQQDDTEAEQEVLGLVMSTYNKQMLPKRRGTEAQVEMHVNDISSLDELHSEFTLDLMYSEMWQDPRLAFSHLSRCVRNITLDLDYLERLWSPNTCIVNSKWAEIHASPSPNVFLILYADGNIWKNCRMMVKAPCSIDLRRFPFDEQTCSMVFESYSYNSQRVSLRWFPKAPITLMQRMDLPDFTLVDWKAEQATVEYPNGAWDQLRATFVFRRRYGFFILQAFVPTYMTVFVAWINFWMDPKELSTRATLSISAFLAITLQFGNILKNQPPVSYVKSLDVWMLACICFLFGALAELAVVSYMKRCDGPTGEGAFTKKKERPVAPGPPPLRPKRFKLTPYQVDRFMVCLYPPLFALFNVVYWVFLGPKN